MRVLWRWDDGITSYDDDDDDDDDDDVFLKSYIATKWAQHIPPWEVRKIIFTHAFDPSVGIWFPGGYPPWARVPNSLYWGLTHPTLWVYM